MFRQLRQKIVNHGPLVLAVSGGVDSMWAWDFIHTTGVEYSVCHVDHGLRQDGIKDWQMIARLAEARGVNSYLYTLSVPCKTREGWEAAARMQRYQRLEQLRERIQARWIVTAHHADDQVETVLMRLCRGYSHDSLTIREYHKNLWRPFLEVSGEEIRRRATRRKLEWREDPTNQDSSYERNWVRHQVLPFLNQRRNIRKAILRGVSMGVAQEDEPSFSKISASSIKKRRSADPHQKH